MIEGVEGCVDEWCRVYYRVSYNAPTCIGEGHSCGHDQPGRCHHLSLTRSVTMIRVAKVVVREGYRYK